MSSTRHQVRAARAAVACGALLLLANAAYGGYLHVYEGQSIQAAIDSAVDGEDIIVVHGGTYNETIDFLGKVIWVFGVDGPAATILDGTGLGVPVVQFANNETAGSTLQGFTITNGYAINGGGMYTYGASPTIYDCIFTGNAATSDGGAIYNGGGGAPAVLTCTFTGNTATNRGGAIYNVDGSSPFIRRCLFDGNQANTGGAIYYRDSASPTVTNCVFMNNAASFDGGAIYSRDAGLLLVNSTFTSNEVDTSLAIIAHDGGAGTITNCILWNDAPHEILDYGSGLTVSYSDVQGTWPGAGNIDIDPQFFFAFGDGLPRLDRYSPCIDAGDNSAVLPDDQFDFDGPPNARMVDDPDVADTGAGSPPITDMGAFERQQGSANATVFVPGDFATIQAAINYCLDGDEIIVTPGTYPGGINFNGKAITLRSTEPTDPAVVAATVLDGQGANHVIRCSAWEGPDTVLSGFTITGGHADGSSLPEYCGAGMLNENSSPTITYCVFVDNWAHGHWNTMNAFGGGMGNLNSSPTISYCTFEMNTAGAYNGGWHQGGGMYNSNSSPVLSHCTFTANSARDGGGMLCENGSAPSVEDCAFLNNTTTGSYPSRNGGAINIVGDSSCTLVDTVFENNRTGDGGDGDLFSGGDTGSGGALWFGSGASAVITGCSFLANYTGHGGDSLFVFGGDSGDGGAIYSSGDSVSVTNCVFEGNYTSGAGWGLLGSGHHGDGGGMYNSGSYATVTNCTFSGNAASHGGGMLNVEISGDQIVTDCAFIGNTAVNDGGGMHNYTSSPNVTNCTFSGNTASRNGGGMLNYEYSAPTVANCTFSENTASASTGGMLNGNGSNPTVANCILWGNSTPEILDLDTSTSTVTYSDVQGGYVGTGNIDADPLFIDPDNGDFRLSSASPCIDAGDNSAVPEGIATDIDGNPRFVDDPDTIDTGYGDPPVVDMGAYEFQGASCPCDCETSPDGSVDAGDFLALLAQWGGPGSCDCEDPPDGAVDAGDFLALLAGWGSCP